MSIKKHGSAKWTGNLKEGKGHVSTQTGVLNDQPYGFQTRFEGKSGTNPEELIGAAHASCFSMALSMILEGEDLVADSIETKATVHLEQKDGGFHIPKVHLDVTASIPNATEEQFNRAANTAKENCPISKLLTAEITMDAKLA
ncbi:MULTISPECIES: OsmC family protein [unclassified Sulfitobacter]|jgi:lipoyl-dependent peroxiredoxin|uniref:OsmC family protein n=2 Tax=Sulfitobacter TaxID=60136 RepID=UPI0007C39CDE|nr:MULTISPECIES: OsmC family protein [unclassified Sulfitobacter]KZY06276.1 osmotically inducible protein OsmC [Sulfitobacter sp. HI0023]KZY24657.1 osmotically inducible protein OsmC [Sulfitobacter sp. HI0040]KZZ68608.1 osmotically inducible protein OsmC [Sulfitobacter sp. HI0129]MAM25297.1 OsmC family peroxiredoxin [Paracoccaceae bacterium]|tara:strand:- start:299 stop:727 length:429 start_codon:yes stop_codon:yes gene_type:complete